MHNAPYSYLNPVVTVEAEEAKLFCLAVALAHWAAKHMVYT
jgi:hypothetical protein